MLFNYSNLFVFKTHIKNTTISHVPWHGCLQHRRLLSNFKFSCSSLNEIKIGRKGIHVVLVFLASQPRPLQDGSLWLCLSWNSIKSCFLVCGFASVFCRALSSCFVWLILMHIFSWFTLGPSVKTVPCIFLRYSPLAIWPKWHHFAANKVLRCLQVRKYKKCHFQESFNEFSSRALSSVYYVLFKWSFC